MDVTAFAPGRVNLIGEHTDHTGGRCLPMAVDLGVTVTGRRHGDRIVLDSGLEAGRAAVSLAQLGDLDPTSWTPAWARFVAAVAALVRPSSGLVGSVSSTVPAGAGMSSSAALEIALALALGGPGLLEDPVALAGLGQAAERAATGVPCGILDQLASVAGVEGHALVLDCHTLTWTPVAVPDHVEVVVVHSGQSRTLAGSGYAARRAECEAAEAEIGPLRLATTDDVAGLDDPVLRRRARHVVTENQRVLDAADALASGDLSGLGALLDAGHASLRDDFAVSTSVVDATVDRLRAQPGVHGVRLMGGGFGGCVVAVADPGAVDPTSQPTDAWVVRAGGGARVVEAGGSAAT